MTKRKKIQRAVESALDLPQNAAKSDAERQRYATDPEYRERKQQNNRRWKDDNADKQRQYAKKWSQKNGAAAAKRYRERKKAEREQRPG